MEMLDKAVMSLIEHFDSVQLVATMHNAEGSALYAAGRGNWYSRLGAMTCVLEQLQEGERLIERGRNEE
jgi:hypothetical protein